jgi:glycosyltransferase involved in cell wall biosynthesis
MSLNNQDCRFNGRLALQQRVLPLYRAPFFDALGEACEGGLSVFAGQPLPDEAIKTTDQLKVAHYVPARNRHIGRLSSPFYLCWQSGLLRWLNDWQPDAIILEANPRYLSSRMAANWMHSRGRPVLGWGLGVSGAIDKMESVRRPGRQRFLGMFDGLISYSQRGAEAYIEMGFSPERVFVAPNAVAPHPNKPLPKRPTAFDGQAALLYVGRLQDRKRIDNLLHACAALPADLKPRLWIVGAGPAQNTIKALAASVYPEAEFPGAKHGSELERYFTAADLFVLPGTGGLAVQEAMSYGLPVIVAEGDGTQDDLVRPENGWRIPSNDREALTNAILDALTDVNRLRSMGGESYRIVDEEVNVEKMVAAFIDALNTVSAGLQD